MPIYPYPVTNQIKKVQQRSSIALSESALSSIKDDLSKSTLDLPLATIINSLRTGVFTPTQLMRHLSSRALAVHANTNCLTEIMIPAALNETAAREKELIKLPLAGIPISFKDNYKIKGLDTSLGFSSWCGEPAEDDAGMVKIIRELGGVPFVKTNVPQTLLAFDSWNPVFGATLNPFNTKLIPGGSSGGEAALIASKGSFIGFGTDIGGSLRIPAHFCGIYALKPTSLRMTRRELRGPVRGQIHIPAVTGPLTRDMDSLTFITRLVIEHEEWRRDTSLVPLPWREPQLPAKLRIGYYTTDGNVKATPACARAVEQTINALRALGHECIEFQVPQSSLAATLYPALVGADQMRMLTSPIHSDLIHPAVRSNLILSRLPNWLKLFIVKILEWFDEVEAAGILRASLKKTVGELWLWQGKLDEYKMEFEAAWEAMKSGEKEMDFIIAPGFAMPAPKHEGIANISIAASYTYLYNMLDYTVGTVPATVVQKDKDAVPEDWFKNTRRGKPNVLERQIYKWYDPIFSDGSPVGVQVIGKKWEEEKILAAMTVVDQALEAYGRKRAILNF